MIHRWPFCVRMVAECSIRFELGHGSIVLDLTMWDLNAQVCLWTVPGCHVLNASLTGGCVDRHVAMVMVVLQSACSTAPVVSAPCFL